MVKGQKLFEEIKKEILNKIKDDKRLLTVILIGDFTPSKIYVKQGKSAQELE